MTRVCAFCRNAKLSNEHIFPGWLRTILPEQENWRAQERARIFRPGTAEEKRLLIAPRKISEPFTESRVKRVCRDCNHGWMNELELQVRPALTRLVKGEAVHLSAEDVRTLAACATKTTMVFEFTDPGSQAYRELEHRWLREEREPPAGTLVWAAALEELNDWGVRAEHMGILIGPRGLDINLPCNTQQTTIGLGRVLLVVIHSLSTALPMPPFESMGGTMPRLWPGPHELTWPPQHALPDQMAWFVHGSLAFIAT
jgi:hypothetical protein